MRVLFLQRQPCIKTLKYAVALRARVPGLHLEFAYQGRTLSDFYGEGDELFDAWHLLAPDPTHDLRRVVERVRPDVIHSHNLPDTLTVAALEVAGGRVPIVHDVHDFQSLRATPYEDGFPDPPDPIASERAAIEGSDALITVSDVLLEEITARYAVPAPHLVVPNFALARDLPPLPDELETHEQDVGEPLRFVYEGTISTCGGHYDLREIFAAIASTPGVRLDVHCGREPMAAYRGLAERFDSLTLHPPMPTRALMRMLPRYDVGWAGFNATLNDAHLETVLPNKAFEYVGAGLGVLTLPHKALARWVEAEGVGIVLDSLDDLSTSLRAADVETVRKTARAHRERYTLDAHIHEVLGLYRSLGAGPA
ncbi:glycosyltransferase [Knoellia koreensis]|uniref:Glycosyltransferase n=1 Tax=Knoellia koreensis TaxID=2730921 RepID=A0A849HKJ8_9MICO|nr:glycosyltransferase [Knoellia sp. DB2414S]NNM47948.1 glycosyltransferase [Knoellia sp. DB2414S]